jgi:hypothetical protein
MSGLWHEAFPIRPLPTFRSTGSGNIVAMVGVVASVLESFGWHAG